MVNSEEIVERSFYASLLKEMLSLGVTVNPDDYLPISEENEKRFEEAVLKLKKFIPLFGIGNNQSRGAKQVPRITLELQGYFPGDIGHPNTEFEKAEGGYQVIEYDWDTKDITIDVHLVAGTQTDMRLLHNILYRALPARGYMIPYLNNDFETYKNLKIKPTGNLFIELTNYYDHPDLDHGLLEKVYSYICKDGILWNKTQDMVITPIRDISILLGPDDVDEANHLNISTSD